MPLAQSRQLVLPRLHRNLLRRRRKARNYKALVLAEPVAAVVPRSDDLIFPLSSCLFLWMWSRWRSCERFSSCLPLLYLISRPLPLLRPLWRLSVLLRSRWCHCDILFFCMVGVLMECQRALRITGRSARHFPPCLATILCGLPPCVMSSLRHALRAAPDKSFPGVSSGLPASGGCLPPR